jgi:hypothetical protein
MIEDQSTGDGAGVCPELQTCKSAFPRPPLRWPRFGACHASPLTATELAGHCRREPLSSLRPWSKLSVRTFASVRAALRDALLATDCHVVAGPRRDGERYQAACGRPAVAGDKLTKFVNTAGDDCAARDARALLYAMRLHRGSVLPCSWHLYCLENRAMFESGGFASRRGGTGSGRKPRADPDEATYEADQGHAGADYQAAAFQVDPRSADYRVIVAGVLGFVVSRIPEGRKGKRWTTWARRIQKTKRRASLQ